VKLPPVDRTRIASTPWALFIAWSALEATTTPKLARVEGKVTVPTVSSVTRTLDVSSMRENSTLASAKSVGPEMDVTAVRTTIWTVGQIFFCPVRISGAKKTTALASRIRDRKTATTTE
jgi:hypothetical protein